MMVVGGIRTGRAAITSRILPIVRGQVQPRLTWLPEFGAHPVPPMGSPAHYRRTATTAARPSGATLEKTQVEGMAHFRCVTRPCRHDSTSPGRRGPIIGSRPAVPTESKDEDEPVATDSRR